MRILFLSPRQCWPPHSGAKLREYHFAKALGEHSELTFVHFMEPGAPPMTASHLPFARKIVSVPKPKAYGLGQMVRGVTGKWPLSILNYDSPAMHRAVESVKGAYDFVHLDGIHMSRYAQRPASWGAKPVYNWHNIESEAMLRFRGTVSSPAKRYYSGVTAHKLAALERSNLQTAFGHVVCSERERGQLLQLAPQARIVVVENGVDCASFSENDAPTNATGLLFVGQMDYFPNIDAAIFFAHGPWARLREKFPLLTLTIVGANPTPAVLELAKLPGITVTGTVPEVKPFYRDRLAAIVPLRTGGGTRLKILEAMAARVPVISTALGAEGLPVTPGQNILLADSNDDPSWLRQIELLQNSPQRRTALTTAARTFVEQHFDWPLLGQKLLHTYRLWNEPPQPV